jgi:hypothetical protein
MSLRYCYALLSALLGCSPEPVLPEEQLLPPAPFRVLFVGNSLTYTNDLPHTVAAIAQSAGDEMAVAMAAGANLALIDHLNGGSNAPAQIRSGQFNYVVLQQGPTPAGICRDSLILWTTMFDERIRGAQARTAVMMSWPGANGQQFFDDVRYSFQAAATAVDGIFLPAGEAWRAAWREDPSLPLYGPDGFHPSPMGTFLAALEIYERLSGRDARTLPAEAFNGAARMNVPEEQIRLLQRAAHAANTTFPAAPGVAIPAKSTGKGSC